MNKKIRLMVLASAILFQASVADAAQWQVVEKVTGRDDDMAAICHFWNANIFPAGVKESCTIGTLFFVDLFNRQIYFADQQELRNSRQDINLTERVLHSTLIHDGGYDRLERLRDEQEERHQERIAAAEAYLWRKNYLAAFNGATTIETMRDFEKRYTNNDPDGLIQNLAPLKAKLEYKEYRERFDSSKSFNELSDFIVAYQGKDTDNIIPDAKKRMALAFAREEKERERSYAEKQAEERRSEIDQIARKIIWCNRKTANARLAIDRERRVASVSGYENKLILREAGEIIISCQDSVPRNYAEYRKKGGTMLLGDLR